MKKRSKTKIAETAKPSTSERTIRLRTNEKKVTPPKPKTRDNVFSKSRDTREDRSARQMKNSHSSQTFSHGR
jgi:hypothetical protein